MATPMKPPAKIMRVLGNPDAVLERTHVGIYDYLDQLASLAFGQAVTLVKPISFSDILGQATYAQLPNGLPLSVLGRAANSAGVQASIAASAGSGAALRESGSTIGWGQLATAAYTDNSVTYAKIQQVSAADRLLGRGHGAGVGNVQEISLGNGLSMSGTVLSAAGSFSMALSYGLGNANGPAPEFETYGVLPTLAEGVPEFWIHPSSGEKSVDWVGVGSGIPHEWLIQSGGPYSTANMGIRVEACNFTGAPVTVSLLVIVTKNGSETACGTTFVTGASGNFPVSQAVSFTNSDTVGVKFRIEDPIAVYSGGFVKMSVYLRLT